VVFRDGISDVVRTNRLAVDVTVQKAPIWGRAPVLELKTFVGGSVSLKCPMPERFASDVKFRAFFEPKLKEFWLSRKSGMIEAGAKDFPFSVFFAPGDSRPIECGEIETELCVKVCGVTTGFEKRGRT
jgi:hypothetical protein